MLKLIFVYNNVYTIITIPVGYHISSRYIIVYNNESNDLYYYSIVTVTVLGILKIVNQLA